MKKTSLFYLLTAMACLVLSFSACKKDKIEDQILDGKVNMRIKNVSNYDFKDVQVEHAEVHEYGDVNKGDYSAYSSYDELYSYAYVHLKINGEIYQAIPIDFVGETPLEPGKYTYELDIPDIDNHYVSIKLVEE